MWCSAMAYVTPTGRFGHSTGLYRKTNPLLTALTPQYQPESPLFRGNQFFTGWAPRVQKPLPELAEERDDVERRRRLHPALMVLGSRPNDG